LILLITRRTNDIKYCSKCDCNYNYNNTDAFIGWSMCVLLTTRLQDTAISRTFCMCDLPLSVSLVYSIHHSRRLVWQNTTQYVHKCKNDLYQLQINTCMFVNQHKTPGWCTNIVPATASPICLKCGKRRPHHINE